MLIKTDEFDDTFNKDLGLLQKISRSMLRHKGSYKTKKIGEFVTDIDIEATVTYNDHLLYVIYSIITEKDQPFRFIHMEAGKMEGYQLPWSIDTCGGCDYSAEKTKLWFDWFSHQGMVSNDTLNYINYKIFSSDLKIRDLIDVENELSRYSSIFWGPEDIRKGYIRLHGYRYNLLDIMTTETPVLEFLYKYDTQYVSVDFGLKDFRFKNPSPESMYKWYTQDWYKIMKSFRWKLKDEHKAEYFDDMANVNNLVALKNQADLLLKLETNMYFDRVDFDIIKYRLVSNLEDTNVELYRGETLWQLSLRLKENVNDMLKHKAYYYADLLKPKESKNIRMSLMRGVESQIPVGPEKIYERRKDGVRCPFFSMDTEDFKRIIDVSIRADMNAEVVINCFSELEPRGGHHVRKILDKIIGVNDFSISEKGSGVLLRDGDRELGEFPLSRKTDLQKLVFFSDSHRPTAVD